MKPSGWADGGVMKREYHYFNGQIVKVGDRVRLCGKYPGIVEEVEMPGTQQAYDTGCPDGYVCTSDYRDGIKGSVLWTPPDGMFWEDLELIDRAKSSSPPSLMKKILFLGVAVLVVAGGWLWYATRFTTSSQIFRERLKPALNAAGWEMVEMRSVRFPLRACGFTDQQDRDLGLLIRRAVHPLPQVDSLGRSGNGWERDLLESKQSQKRVRCCVQYVGNMVAHIVVVYPPSAKQDGLELREVLQRTFPNDGVSLFDAGEFGFKEPLPMPPPR